MGLGNTVSESTATIPSASQLVNEVMNFPSTESANDAQPLWWSEKDANATLTEVDVAGEAGVTENYERALKVVVATANSYAAQRYTYADQPRIKSGRTLSAIVAVWSVSSAVARIRLQSSVGSLGVSANTSAAGWTILTVEGVTLDGTYVELRCEVDIGTAYFVPLGVNIGASPVALPTRKLVYRSGSGATVLSGNGASPATWTDIDLTSASSAIAVIFELHIVLFESTEGYRFRTRMNGSSLTSDAVFRATAIGGSTRNTTHWQQIGDDAQIIEYELERDAGASTVDVCLLCLDGWWEWE